MSEIGVSHYKTRPEPDEPYFEDALAGDADVPVGRQIINGLGALVVLAVAGIAVLVVLLWRSPS